MNRKKLTKERLITRLLVALLGVAILVAYVGWGIDYIYASLGEKASVENQQLTDQIESARHEIDRISKIVDKREEKLSQANELLASEQKNMPGELNINDLINTVIEIARRSHVQATPLTTTPPETQMVNDRSYSYWRISMSVRGEFADIVEFVDSLDGKDIATGTVADVVLERNDEEQETAGEDNYVASVSGKITLVVFTRPQK
ncbi:type 4a pilus biogenesis protein PilO [Bacteroidota bacterium]